jgi:hypothetical protein
MPKVLKGKKHLRNGAVFIGHPSIWANPYAIGRDGTREEVIAKYRRMVEANPAMIQEIKRELRGKDLVCYCAPLACHGDVLLEIANS